MNELTGIAELSTTELEKVNGGLLWEALLITGIGLLITEWESTKKAARDAWTGSYDPPE